MTTPVIPVLDISPRAQDLARVIDRLPSGTFELTITKNDLRAVAWNVKIERVETIQTMVLSKYAPE